MHDRIKGMVSVFYFVASLLATKKKNDYFEKLDASHIVGLGRILMIFD